jgi:hypothetical protein
MLDPFFIGPLPALSRAVQPLADRFSMVTLPHHIHEVLGAALFYTFIHLVVSPVASSYFFPAYYPKHSRSKKVNWDSHVVSLFQSVLINIVALWIMWTDQERKNMDWEQRIWGYTGAAGMVQALVVGYFVWDFVTTLAFLDVFGLGLLAHAVSALVVYSFGYVGITRPGCECLDLSLPTDHLQNSGRSSTTTVVSLSSTNSRLRS